MKQKSIWNFLPPAGPILSIGLIGLVLLSGLLYYRAVKIQRFLEPALAFSQPRNEYSKRIAGLFQKEFGKNPINGLEYKMGVIHLRPTLLLSPDGRLSADGLAILKKLGIIFVSLMRDEKARSEISLILISARVPASPPLQAAGLRMRSHMMAGFIQDGLFQG